MRLKFGGLLPHECGEVRSERLNTIIVCEQGCSVRARACHAWGARPLGSDSARRGSPCSLPKNSVFPSVGPLVRPDQGRANGSRGPSSQWHPGAGKQTVCPLLDKERELVHGSAWGPRARGYRLPGVDSSCGGPGHLVAEAGQLVEMWLSE